MTVSGISGNVPSPTPAVDPVKTAQVGPTTAKTTSITPKHDTVNLTGTALAKSLKLSGQTAAQGEIAQKMSLPIATVDSYLGIQTPVTVTPQTPKAAAAAAPPQVAATPPGKKA